MSRVRKAPPRSDGALRRWLRAHRQALRQCGQQLRTHHVGSLITIAVIGVTLALPTALYVLVGNASVVSDAWRGTVQLSLYLKTSTPETTGETLATTLQSDPQVASARYISKDAALDTFRDRSGFRAVLDLLDENPLPASIVLTPAATLDREAVEMLRGRMASLPEVELAQLDQLWLERLQALLLWVHRVIIMLALAISLAVVVIIGNTLRLEIARNRDAIVVMKLIGATERHIQRPYLYSGVLLGVLGGGMAWLLVALLVQVLRSPTRQLAHLYESSFQLAGPDLVTAAAVIGGGLILGGSSALWTVRRHLAGIEPQFSGPGAS